MSRYHLDKPAVVTFDPAVTEYESESVKLKEVWADELARTFYLAYSKGHLRSQFFLAACMDFAKAWRCNPAEYRDRAHLSLVINWSMRRDGLLAISMDFVDELLPFVNGEKKLEYEIWVNGRLQQ